MLNPHRHREIFFDEIVPDAVGSRFDSLEKPLRFGIFYFVYFILLFAVVFTISRLLYLNQFLGTLYVRRSLANVTREVLTPAPRGIIVDRFGEPLVENEPSFSVFINLADFFRLPPSGAADSQSGAISTLVGILNLPEEELSASLSSVNLERQGELVVAKNVSLNDALSIKGRHLNSVYVIDDFRRSYRDPYAFSHILGYTGEVTPSDLKRDPELDLGDAIGKGGLELVYDDSLRGTKGAIVDFQDVRGSTIDERAVGNPVPGRTLSLTIDADLQEFFYRRMSLALENLGRTSGVGLAINPQTGEVLAALSFPSYDNNVFSDPAATPARQAVLNNPLQPLFNRFTSGVYNPGSTIKPLVATAALKEGIVNTSNIFFSKGYIEVPNPYHPDQPSRFLDWRPNGWVDIYSALARSSNIYFYYVGGGFEDFKGLGIAKLREWWTRFGLNKPTGIDLPDEKYGLLPDQAERETRTGSPWRVGDTYNVSIGQGDLAVTPLELLNYITAVANGGAIYRPYLNSALGSRVLYDLTYLSPELTEVARGLTDTVVKPYGTAYILHDLPITSAAKTGSAQVAGNTKTNAFTVAYAPVESPQIALLVLVEDAREGSLNTVPIAKEVLYWYATNRLR